MLLEIEVACFVSSRLQKVKDLWHYIKDSFQHSLGSVLGILSYLFIMFRKPRSMCVSLTTSDNISSFTL